MNTDLEGKAKNMVWLLRRVVALVYQYSRLMVKQYGITSPQYIALKVLAQAAEPLSAVALSKELKVTPANITAILDRLEAKGYVRRTRKVGDRRTLRLELTEQGMEFTNQLNDLMEVRVVEELRRLNPHEVEALNDALRKLVSMMDAKGLDEAASAETFNDLTL